MFDRRLALFAASVALLLPLSAFADAEKENAKNDKKKVSIAHIKLSGSLAEKPPSVDPLLGEIGETFKAKLDRIKKAREDKSIQALLLEINDLAPGWGKLNELVRAVEQFRASGKKVYAHLESGSQAEYILGAACDEVCLPEGAWLMLTGLRMEATFYKGLLEKLGVKADMLQMGNFKGAAEPYTRESLSEDNKKQMTAVLDDYFENELIGRIVKTRTARKFGADKVKQLIEDGPYSARHGLKAGLIDRVDYLDSYETTIKGLLKADTLDVVRDYGKKKDEEIDIFGLYRKLLFGPSKATTSRAPKVAVIYATGPIMTGKSGASLLGGESVGSDTLVKAIREAETDKSVKAIVLRVDSPGGSALASDLIWNELKRSKKPVVASMSNVAASGGYYISMAARKIYAEPGTLTGSIGVVGGKMALRGVYDKVGIKTETIVRGKNSGLLGGTDPFSPSERASFKALMEDCYDQFVDKAVQGRVAAGKKMTREDLLKLAGGRIWTGRQAKENGLIDELGTLDDAITAAAKMAGMPTEKEPELLMLPKAKNSLESLLGSAFDISIGVDVKALRKAGLGEVLQGVDTLLELRKEPVWMILPYRVDVK